MTAAVCSGPQHAVLAVVFVVAVCHAVTAAAVARTFPVVGGGACATAQDCSLGGTCTAGGCVCDGWLTGPHCASLRLTNNATTSVALPANVSGTTFATVWGGHRLVDGAGRQHWIGSGIRDGKTLAAWAKDSVAVHASFDREGNTSSLSSARIDGIALSGNGDKGSWHGGSLHGIYVIANPRPWANGTDAFLMFFTGFNVSGAYGSRRIGVAYARSASGPWTVWPDVVLGPAPAGTAIDDSSVSNAAPAFYNDGSGRLLVAYKGLGKARAGAPPCTDGSGRPCVFVAQADHWTGPYTRTMSALGEYVYGEDPTLWHDARGNWHLVYEHYVGTACGGHAFSSSGTSSWNTTDPTTWYTTHVTLDGKPTTLRKRERPQLVLSEHPQQPVALYNGACLESGRCFNIAMDFA